MILRLCLIDQKEVIFFQEQGRIRHTLEMHTIANQCVFFVTPSARFFADISDGLALINSTMKPYFKAFIWMSYIKLIALQICPALQSNDVGMKTAAGNKRIPKRIDRIQEISTKFGRIRQLFFCSDPFDKTSSLSTKPLKDMHASK